MNIGDRVVITRDHPDGNNSIFEGDEGHLVSILDDFGIEFDREVVDGHSCTGNGQNGYCWYVTEDCFSIISSPSSNYEDELI